ncbi:MAG TPA: hypothetical protein VFP84_04390 [Kofleriaceae bacterium]|nr:hypothetical protein [Kofleriaceae bacterium]
MRARSIWLTLLMSAAACAPKHAVGPAPREDDLELPPGARSPESVATSAPEPDAPRPIAAPGKGLRTGTVARARLLAVLDAGLGNFLRQVEVAPRQRGERFVGWQVVQVLDPSGPLHDLDVMPGDVLLSVNGQPLARPEQAQAMWDSLRAANEVTAQLWRGPAKLELKFTVDP